MLLATASVVCEREATRAALPVGEASSCFVRSLGFQLGGLLVAARWTKLDCDKSGTNVIVVSLLLHETVVPAHSACGEEVG